MVKLNKIYTRTGDDGTTGLGTGARVPKHDLRVTAYGTVDEANAVIGLALRVFGMPGINPGELAVAGEIGTLLESIQHDLFDVGADLCCPIGKTKDEAHALRVTQEQTKRIEQAIDAHNDLLEPLTSFVLPGGSSLAAHLHHARTVVRRAERCATALIEADAASVNPETVRYLNRLSDLLFVLARVANGNGAEDVLWKPGKNRQGSS